MEKVTVNDVNEMVLQLAYMQRAMNTTSISRARLARAMGEGGDPRRNLDDECGYARPGELTVEMFQTLYDRDAIAARVITVFPEECWKVSPVVRETEDEGEETEFESAVKELDRNLTGSGFFEPQETGSLLWEYLHRADRLSGIGWYGALLLGFDDGKDLSEPVEPGNMSLRYIRAFPQSNAQITAWESDRTSPRYMQPTQYLLTFNNANNSAETASGTYQSQVHWSRVIHVADGVDGSEVFGTPRCQQVYNRIYDLQKLYGGSAEMYWQGAFPGLSVESIPQLGPDVELSDSQLKDLRQQFEQYFNGLQRYLAVTGFNINSLSPQVVSPSDQIDNALTAICVKMGIPKRVFMGSERGELASSQDAEAWIDRLQYRQNNYLTPRLIVPFFSRLIWAGALPEPSQYYVRWPDLRKLNAETKSGIAARTTEALVKYVQGGAEALIPPVDFLVKVLDWTQEEATAALDNAIDLLDQEEGENPEEEEDDTV